MANYWTEFSGKILTTLEEKITTTYNLPIKSEFLPLAENNMNISISSGTIPRGMNLSGYSLVGTPYEVNKDTKYTFVVDRNSWTRCPKQLRLSLTEVIECMLRELGQVPENVSFNLNLK